MNGQRSGIYERLAAHLDTLPDGYPPSSTGAHLRVLRKLFSPDEAELAVHLTLKRETADEVAKRAGGSADVVRDRLARMARRGLILAVERPGEEPLYQAVPFVIGIFEFQVNDLTQELLADLVEYAQTSDSSPHVKTIPQLRTIPVGVSLDSRIEALPYERAEALVEAHDRFAVASCLCRTITRMWGEGCDAPLETCLFFGDWADYYVNTERGRRIERDDVMRILRQANEANLVLQSSNTKEAVVICCCCGCCCGVLTPLKRLEAPAAEVASAFAATHDEETCIRCLRCIDRCQMDAIHPEGDGVLLNRDRCVGCGLCVATCPSGALRLVRRDRAFDKATPENMDELWEIMQRMQGTGGAT